ncbi:MAG: DedA family protein [Novosphingobium sp.]
MIEWMIRLIEDGGYLGIFLLMVIENVFPPIPSEVIMGLGGVAMARGTLQFWPLLLAGSIGSTIGNLAWYVLGDRLGYRRLRPLVMRWGRWLTLEWQDVEKASSFFRSHGTWIVFALRMSPLLRTIISLPAGLSHMSPWRFLAYTFAGSALWNTGLILGGSWVGGALGEAQHVLGWIMGVLVALTLAAYAWRVVTWRPSD